MYKQLTARVRQHMGTKPTELPALQDALARIGIDVALHFRTRDGQDITVTELAKVLASFDLDVLALPMHGTGARVRKPQQTQNWPPVRQRPRLHAAPSRPEVA